MRKADVLVLGTVALRIDGRVVTPSARNVRALIGVLALAGQHGASDTALSAQLWGERSSRAALRVLVHRTRAWLAETAGGLVTVRRTATGYRLHLEHGECDLHKFHELVAAAAGQPHAARADLLASALSLWRGPVLEGLRPPVIGDDERMILDKARMGASVDCAGAWLSAGHPDRALRLIDPVVRQDPLDEAAHGVWIEALAANGRQADALAAYENLRVRLREELGVDPSRQVSRSLTRVLRQEVVEPTDPAADGGITPAQLPAQGGAFVGRTAQLDHLDRLLLGADGTPRVNLVVIAGAGGIGKTTLAVRWAHRMAGRYPDGQLYVDLLGYAHSPPLRPLDALATFLRALGVPSEQVPTGLDEAAGMFRSVLSGRRMLILLDNAYDAAQVRPLLPGSPLSAVLVTSRDRLDGLVAINGAALVELDVLDSTDAVALLVATVGRQRIEAEPDAAMALAGRCAYLPLALRITAAHLIARPRLRLAENLEQRFLLGTLARMTVDGDEQAAVAGSFGLSYRRLDPIEQQVFRAIGLVPGADVTAEPLAAMLDHPVRCVLHALDRLVVVHLVAELAPGRYTCHDLLRAYAEQLAEQEMSPVELKEARARLGAWYAAAAYASAGTLFPHTLRLPAADAVTVRAVPELVDAVAATAWLEVERANIVSTALLAAGSDHPEVAWQLADATRMYLFRWRHPTTCLRLAEVAARAATSAGDPHGRAAAALALATAYGLLGDVMRAIEHCRDAVRFSQEAGWPDGEAGALANLAILHTEVGDLDSATALLRQARELSRRMGNVAREAASLNNLGTVHLCAGQLADAVACHRAALINYRRLGFTSHEQVTMHNLGIALRETGNLDEAAELFEAKLAAVSAAGEQHGAAAALGELARIHCDRGDLPRAKELAERAWHAAQGLGDRLQEAGVLIQLAEVDRRCGNLRQATAHSQRALRLAKRVQNARLEAEALIGLARAEHSADQLRSALRHARQAMARSHECGFRSVEAKALTTLAGLQLAVGDARQGATLGRLALDIQSRVGNRLGEAHACLALADCLSVVDGESSAAPLVERGQDIFRALGVQPAI